MGYRTAQPAVEDDAAQRAASHAISVLGLRGLATDPPNNKVRAAVEEACSVVARADLPPVDGLALLLEELEQRGIDARAEAEREQRAWRETGGRPWTYAARERAA